MTYDQHNKQQIAASNHRRVKQRIKQQPVKEKEKQISLTQAPNSNSSTVFGDGKKGGGGLGKRDGGHAEGGEVVGVWLNWEFKCLDGYQAHAGIGLRAVWYSAHGQEFEFVPRCEDDVLGERWVYGLSLWC